MGSSACSPWHCRYAGSGAGSAASARRQAKWEHKSPAVFWRNKGFWEAFIFLWSLRLQAGNFMMGPPYGITRNRGRLWENAANERKRLLPPPFRKTGKARAATDAFLKFYMVLYRGRKPYRRRSFRKREMVGDIKSSVCAARLRNVFV